MAGGWRTTSRGPFALLALALTAGCDYGPRMRPGDPCLACHRAAGSASGGAFSAAGTVYDRAEGGSALKGATVTLRDQDGAEVQVVTNSVGNFYTRRPLNFPVVASVGFGDYRPTTPSAPMAGGDCNGCHQRRP